MQKVQKANEACSHFLEGMVQQFERPDMSEMQDQMLAFSQCMRDHGVDFPDPEIPADGGPIGMQFEVDPNDPTFQAAQEACQEIFGEGPGGFVIGGTGGPVGGIVGVAPPGGGTVTGGGSDDSSAGG